MKSLFNGLLCASLLVFASGCGKDNKTGNKVPGIQNVGMNPVVHQNMPQEGQVALTNLKNWYAAPDSSNLNFRGTFIKETQSLGGFQYEFEGRLCIFGWGINCDETAPKPTHCFIKNSSNNYDLGTATGYSLSECSITQQNLVKSSNQELSAAVNGNGLPLLNITQVGQVYRLYYGTNPYQPQVVYTIDTNFHSILNPVQVQQISSSGSTLTSVKALQTFSF